MAYEVDRSNPDLITATNSVAVISVADGGTVFHRNAIRKHLKTGETEHISWLVCELDGVRLYVNGDNMILTKRDLNP